MSFDDLSRWPIAPAALIEALRADLRSEHHDNVECDNGAAICLWLAADGRRALLAGFDNGGSDIGGFCLCETLDRLGMPGAARLQRSHFTPACLRDDEAFGSFFESAALARPRP